MGKRQGSPPEGRRWLMSLHVLASIGQRKTAHRNGATLDSDSRKWDSRGANTRRASGAATFRGPFSCLLAPFKPQLRRLTYIRRAIRFPRLGFVARIPKPTWEYETLASF